MARTIGISHRVKVTREHKARPTLVAIRHEDGTVTEHMLETEDHEVDFAYNRFPVAYRDLAEGEIVEGIPLQHLKLRKLKSDERTWDFPDDRIRIVDKKPHLVLKIPESYDGLQAGDQVATIFGGSGGRFTYALSRIGQKCGARVYRAPPHALKECRGSDTKEEDHFLLERLFRERSELFHEVILRDKAVIKLSSQYRQWQDIQKDRMACQLRLYAQARDNRFFSEEGGYPEGLIEAEYQRLVASDEQLVILERKEKKNKDEMAATLEKIPVYTEILAKIEGIGPSIAAGLVVAALDIRRFKTKAKLKAYFGVHVLPDGSFPRRRRGQTCSWGQDGRQALYKFFDQMNRRPGSYWGEQFIGWKVKMRERHPEVIVGEGGKKKYTNAHIHKMAAWRTLTKFVEQLYKEWKRLEREAAQIALAKAA